MTTWSNKMKFEPAPTSLKGKKALITGANGGIGKATAEHFSKLGAFVLTTDISDSYIGDSKTDYLKIDLKCKKGLETARNWIEEEKPEILFNNAAIFDMGSVLEASLEQMEEIFSINVKAMYYLMQTCANTLVKSKKKGSIINLSSQAGHRGEALVANYCASKAAVISYTQSAALALAPYKIRVNAISPGVVDTPMWKTVDELFAKFEGKKIGQKKKEVGEAVPLGHMAEPKDIARVAVFLASEQSNYITAQTISVDGGSVLRM